LDGKSRRVVYLFGAGASHGCVKAGGSDRGILMKDLGPDLASAVHDLVKVRYESHRELVALVNEVVNDETDYEHLVTFLDQSASAIHRAFADDLRGVFERVLKQKLDTINQELGHAPTGLYEALLDIYEVPGVDEVLGGILTINYDEYIEQAIQSFEGRFVDFGVEVRGGERKGVPIRLLKLHGSFGWDDAWPIVAKGGASRLWIPPGIQKAKDRYPFNVLWGLAREMLDCDILRIVGCRLSPNDWDLISLLFSTRLTNAGGGPYSVELIGSPGHARELARSYPYLSIRSVLELDEIGPQLVCELVGGEPRSIDSLPEDEQETVRNKADTVSNWFLLWLKQMAEWMNRKYGSVNTPSGRLRALLEE
jgi:hypothetical protein